MANGFRSPTGAALIGMGDALGNVVRQRTMRDADEEQKQLLMLNMMREDERNKILDQREEDRIANVLARQEFEDERYDAEQGELRALRWLSEKDAGPVARSREQLRESFGPQGLAAIEPFLREGAGFGDTIGEGQPMWATEELSRLIKDPTRTQRLQTEQIAREEAATAATQANERAHLALAQGSAAQQQAQQQLQIFTQLNPKPDPTSITGGKVYGNTIEVKGFGADADETKSTRFEWNHGMREEFIKDTAAWNAKFLGFVRNTPGFGLSTQQLLEDSVVSPTQTAARVEALPRQPYFGKYGEGFVDRVNKILNPQGIDPPAAPAVGGGWKSEGMSPLAGGGDLGPVSPADAIKQVLDDKSYETGFYRPGSEAAEAFQSSPFVQDAERMREGTGAASALRALGHMGVGWEGLGSTADTTVSDIRHGLQKFFLKPEYIPDRGDAKGFYGETASQRWSPTGRFDEWLRPAGAPEGGEIFRSDPDGRGISDWLEGARQAGGGLEGYATRAVDAINAGIDRIATNQTVNQLKDTTLNLLEEAGIPREAFTNPDVGRYAAGQAAHGLAQDFPHALNMLSEQAGGERVIDDPGEFAGYFKPDQRTALPSIAPPVGPPPDTSDYNPRPDRYIPPSAGRVEGAELPDRFVENPPSQGRWTPESEVVDPMAQAPGVSQSPHRPLGSRRIPPTPQTGPLESEWSGPAIRSRALGPQGGLSAAPEATPADTRFLLPNLPATPVPVERTVPTPPPVAQPTAPPVVAAPPPPPRFEDTVTVRPPGESINVFPDINAEASRLTAVTGLPTDLLMDARVNPNAMALIQHMIRNYPPDKQALIRDFFTLNPQNAGRQPMPSMIGNP